MRNGYPIRIAHADENSSKKFYVALSCCCPEFLKDVDSGDMFTTKMRNDFRHANCASEAEFLKLCKLAEIEPIGVCVTGNALQNNGAGPDNILYITAQDLQEYVENFQYKLRLIAESKITLKSAKEAYFYVFKTIYGGYEHYAIRVKNPKLDRAPLVRIHSSCYTGDLLASLRCDCRDQLQDAIEFIDNNNDYNGGFILYIMQEGRGIGLANKINAYNLQQTHNLDTVESNLALGFDEDERSFVPAKAMLDFFGITEISLITNNPKKSEDLKNFGINVAQTIPTVFHPNQYNESYLKTKEDQMGHTFKKD